jgi:HAD superfamily hydrolase (TIGR01549 family)
MKPFIFFDLGQTIIDEWEYVGYFDYLLLRTLNGYGAKIDERNYVALKNDILLNRKIGTSGLLSVVSMMAKLILPKGYDKVIFDKIKMDLMEHKTKLIKLFDEVPHIIPLLSRNYRLGIISNNSSGSIVLLSKANLLHYFNTICLSQDIGFKKPDFRIFNKAIDDSSIPKEKCVMVGDRLDIDILPANELGLKTIRTLNSAYRIQKPLNKKEEPLFTVSTLNELPFVLSDIF